MNEIQQIEQINEYKYNQEALVFKEKSRLS